MRLPDTLDSCFRAVFLKTGQKRLSSRHQNFPVYKPSQCLPDLGVRRQCAICQSSW